jgi:hypothetical protein
MRARHNALAMLTAFAPVSSQDASCHTGKYFTSVMLCDRSQFIARNVWGCVTRAFGMPRPNLR